MPFRLGAQRLRPLAAPHDLRRLTRRQWCFMYCFCLKMLNSFKNRRLYNFDLFSIKNTTKNLDFKKRIAYI